MKTQIIFIVAASIPLLFVACGEKDNPSATIKAVDIGLSVKWSNVNLGASSPEGYGDFYAWGETEPKATYTTDNYLYSDTPTTLPLSADAAHKILGGSWRMPTRTEIEELVSTTEDTNYSWEWKSINGHNGWLVTFLVNQNTIFFPAAGYQWDDVLEGRGSVGAFWSSTLERKYSECAWNFEYDSDGVQSFFDDRFVGISIRPVQP